MQVTGDGQGWFNTNYAPAGEVIVRADAASITFSGLDGYRFNSFEFYWINPLALSKRLDLRPNGIAMPAGSIMHRDQYEGAVGVREDRKDPDFTIADLTSAVADTTVQGVFFFQAFIPELADHRRAGGEGYAIDAAVLAADRQRLWTRLGVWKNVTDDISSQTIQTSDGSSAIKAGSRFRVFVGA